MSPRINKEIIIMSHKYTRTPARRVDVLWKNSKREKKSQTDLTFSSLFPYFITIEHVKGQVFIRIKHSIQFSSHLLTFFDHINKWGYTRSISVITVLDHRICSQNWTVYQDLYEKKSKNLSLAETFQHIIMSYLRFGDYFPSASFLYLYGP